MVSEKKRFEAVPSRVDFPGLEEAVLEEWRKNDTFGAVERVRAGADTFVFYEGPPTANGSPGIHHVLSRAFKDVILRYKTMRGFRPVRRGGWARTDSPSSWRSRRSSASPPSRRSSSSASRSSTAAAARASSAT